jgi:hypothetical protein
MLRRTFPLTLSGSLVLFLLSTRAPAAELCIVPSAANNRNITLFCSGIGYSNGAIGYRTDGIPCNNLIGLSCTTAQDDAVWTISASSQDPFVNSGALELPATLYLWLACTRFAEPVALAEFALDGDVEVVDLVPVNDFTNSGTLTELFLAVTGCPIPPLVAAEITVSSTVGVARSSWGQIKALYR